MNKPGQADLPQAVKQAKRIQQDKARLIFLSSPAGVDVANAELETLFEELDKSGTEICEKAPGLELGFERNAREGVMRGQGFSIHLLWTRPALKVTYWNGWVYLGRDVDPKVRKIGGMDFAFDGTGKDGVDWRELRKKPRFFTSANLPNHLVGEVLHKIDPSGSSSQ
jgi:hypothetical protein